MNLKDIFSGGPTPAKWAALGQYLRSSRIVAGIGLRVASQDESGIVISRVGHDVQRPEEKRFKVTNVGNKIYVDPGRIGILNEAYPDNVVRPFEPTLNGTPLSADPRPYFSASAGVTYEVICIFDEVKGRLILLADGDEMPELNNCERAWLIATIKLKTVSGKVIIDELTQNWLSDIPRTLDETSCNSSDSNDSDDSDNSDDSDDSDDSHDSDDSDDSDSSDDSSSSSGECACPILSDLKYFIVAPSCVEELGALIDHVVIVTCKVGAYCADCDPLLAVKFTLGSYSIYRSIIGHTEQTITAEFGVYSPIKLFGCGSYEITAQVVQGVSISPDCGTLTCAAPITTTLVTRGLCSNGGEC